MVGVDRREFTQATLGSVLSFSLLETLFRYDLFADEIKPVTAKWIADVEQLGRDLKDQKLKQIAWQTKVEELYDKVDLADLLRLIDFEKVSRGAKLPDNGALSMRFDFKQIAGVPTKFVFGRQIFGLKKDRSVVPHGHNNMATAFLILKGKLHGRHYDRVQDEKNAMIVRPTIDRAFGPGEHSSISDFKDNVHWFKATSETAFILNIHILGVDQSNVEPTGRIYIDPNGEKLSDGLVRAKRINHEEAHKLYG